MSASHLRALLRLMEEKEDQERQSQSSRSFGRSPPVPAYNTVMPQHFSSGSITNSGAQNLNRVTNNTGIISDNGNGCVNYGGAPVNHGQVNGAINYGPSTNYGTYGR
ncbi:hypothetical protein O6P43_021845 [Quillaja saponaria]|uniref:Uncharacterized protein n=1 Tax=Quillaja saponaria TaxID=32244 RepID=A0AAD7LD55_QUISA|nr:hypothetical protein O6P43_021845 [Quillaja saponaria]